MNKTIKFGLTLLSALLVFSACQYPISQSPVFGPNSGSFPNQVPAGSSTPDAIPGEKASGSVSGLLISEIQGKQHRSPYDGEIIENIRGIVTADRYDGFFIQDLQPDGDDATSDAVFVKNSGQCAGKVGDILLISEASVREFNPAGIGENSLTITNLIPVGCQILSSKNKLPDPVVLGEGGRHIPDKIIENDTNGYVSRNNKYDPDEDGLDFYESLEGMLVEVRNALAVNTRDQYKNLAVVADGGKNASSLSAAGSLVISEDDGNPERILLDDDYIVMPNIHVGAKFTKPIIGIIDYNFGEYNLEPLHKLAYKQGEISYAPVSAAAGDGQLSIVSYNVENFAPDAGPERLISLGNQIVHDLRSPDLIAFQEIQDNDGANDFGKTAADRTIKAIQDAIVRAGGPSYGAVNIDPVNNADGGVPGGNIRPVIFYRLDRNINLVAGKKGASDLPVAIRALNGHALLSNNPGRLGIGVSAFNASRKPLIAEFEISGKRLFVINCHLKSKREDGPLYGEIQPPPLETAKKRNAQAEYLAKVISQLLSAEPAANIVLLGDLNDFPWSEPVKTLESSGLTNLVQLLPTNERFTYVHNGNGQVLDQVLVASGMMNEIQSFKIIHLNSLQEPDDRLSDHDPVYALLNWSN